MSFITSADLTWVHLKQFPSTIIDPYIAEADDWMEGYILRLGIPLLSVATSADQVIKRYLASYIAYRFCEDSICANNTEITENDMYVVSRDKFFLVAEDLRKQLTPDLLTGATTNNLTGGSVSSCVLRRRS